MPTKGTCRPCARCWRRSPAQPRRCAAQTGTSTRRANLSERPPCLPESLNGVPQSMSVHFRTISDLARALRTREISSETATLECLGRIAERNPSINAYIAVLADQALAQARQADAELADGRDRGPLHGVPISLKDIIDLEGVPTTAASTVRNGHIAARDSVVVTRLREAGAVFLGKANLHEFAFGTTNEDSAF